MKLGVFEDTHMFEPEEEEFFDTSEKILKLSDQLAEEIILENISEQLEDNSLNGINSKINYVSLFREKYANITPDTDCYDEEYMKESLGRVAECLAQGLFARYKVELGEDLDYQTSETYLYDMETLYEFLFIRQYNNIVDYLKYQLNKNRESFVEMYSPLMETEEHSKDLFVVQSKKKFKNKEDVLILHFLNEIIHDIKDSVTSGYALFEQLVELDKFEEYNDRMSELLINYGNKLVLNYDEETAKLYMSPLDDSTSFAEIRNAVLIDYLEKCEIDG